MLTVGMAIVRHSSKGDDDTFRIVRLHPNGRFIAVISASMRKVWPKWVERDEWEEALKRDEIEPCEQDPHAQLFDPKYDDPELKKKFKKYARVRENRWRVIRPLVATIDIFDRRKRGKLVEARAVEMNVSENSINKWLRLFWQGGMRKNALVPLWEWNRRGGKSPKQFPTLKLESFKDKQGHVWTRTEAAMAWGLQTFRKDGQSLRQIHQRINQKYFAHGEKFEDGVWVPVLKKESITFWMLRHFYRCKWDKAKDLESMLGKEEYQREYRAQTGTASERARAPGDCFQMDVTEVPITLVHEDNRAIELGKTHLCVVVDQFSGLICGFSIDYRDESSLSYRLAIEHAHTNKVEWCRQRARTIQREDWPCEHLAKTYVIDRGPLRKWQGNQLVNTLGINLENGPAYRPDLRGLVESMHGLIKRKALQLDGAIPRPRTPGRRKGRREACLTIRELEQILMNEILCHNKRTLRTRHFTKGMVRDNIPRVPIKLWAWGIRTSGGSLRQMDVNSLRLNLLPHAYGSVTEKGLVFQKRLYRCDPTLVEKARREGRLKVLVHYQPHHNDEIYRRISLKTTTFEVCALVSGDDASKSTGHLEHAAAIKYMAKLEQEAGHEYIQERAQADARNDELQKQARRKHKDDQKALGIKKNIRTDKQGRRKEAQEKQDKEKRWDMGTNPPSPPPTPSASAEPSAFDDDSDWDAIEAAIEEERLSA